MNRFARWLAAPFAALALAVMLLGVGHAQAPSQRVAVLSAMIDADAQAWASAVRSTGSTVSAAQLRRVSTLVRALKSSTSWTALDDGWLLVSENSTQALISLKQRRLATAVNSPTFTVGQGYTFDGATNYVDTGFIPGTHAVSMTATNTRIAVYELTNVNANTYAAGITFTSNRSIRIRPRLATGSTMSVDPGAQGPSFTLPAADSRGLTSGSRNGSDATTVFAYKNGVAMVRTVDPTGYSATLPTTSAWIGGTNNSGVLSLPRATTIGWFSLGAALTDAQELVEYNAIQAYMTAWGAV